MTIKLGASFIKLAQVLATRNDFFSQEYLDELKSLHDNLPPMEKEEFQSVYNESFGDLNVFKSFKKEPIASASIGQVHIAYLNDGTKVAVKLRRYNIKQQVIADIKIIKFFNILFKPLFSYHTKNSIEAVVKEFNQMIIQEVSFQTELNNLLKFSTTYEKSGIRFPLAYVTLCSDSALVMSFEDGFRFDDKKNILQHNIDFNQIIQKLVNFYMEQMLITGYFHADPHPGNLLVSKTGELILLDFGMVKRVPNDTRVAIIELLKAANEQDYEAFVSANKRLGTIAYEAPTSELAEFTDRMFAIFNNDNLSSESMQQLAFEVLESTRDLPFKLPSDAIYILRVSAIIEGLGTTYIENFNGVKDILPILQDNIPKALGAKESLIESILENIKDLPFIFNDLKHSMKKINEGTIEVKINKEQIEYIENRIIKRLSLLMIPFFLILSSIFILLYDPFYKDISLITFTLGIGYLFLKR